jgi:hypothetical protein
MDSGSGIATLLTAVAPLRALSVPWAVAGGWAIDLVLDRVTRSHHDVDVAIFREDQMALRDVLGGWTFEAVVEGDRRPWPAGMWLDLPTHELYATPPNGMGSTFELLLNERDGDDWVYRRDPAVRRPIANALVARRAGLPVLAPEVVLLYKAKAPRPVDEEDFVAVLQALGAEPRAWFAEALDRCHSGHPWRKRL